MAEYHSEQNLNRVEHLKMVQGIVIRMANNSANMKTWAVSFATSMYIFSGLSNDPHWLIAVGGCIAVFAFWYMDARYLHLEKCYIELHKAVASEESMEPFDLDYRPYIKKVDSIWKVGRSWSVSIFYVSLLAAMSVLFVILTCFAY